MLLHRRLRCFYCNGVAPSDQRGIPRTWECPHCDAVNHLDAHGQLTDPPAHATQQMRPAMTSRAQFAPAMMSSPTRAAAVAVPAPPVFCDACLRNQAIVNAAMGEYIPDEDDPEYDYYVSSADTHREELETRYPQVCESCIDRVRDQIANAGYTARVDFLRRVLESSEQRKLAYNTTRHIWTLRGIWLAQLAYYASVVTTMFWHFLGTKFGSELKWLVENETLSFKSLNMMRAVQLAIAADFVTLWWNPQLEKMAKRPGGRMQRLKILWTIRILALGLRIFGFLNFQTVPESGEELKNFHDIHLSMVVATLVAAIFSCYTVRITYPKASFMKPLDPYLPKVLPRKENTSPRQEPPPRQRLNIFTPKVVRPKTDIFDTMAQDLNASFGAPGAALDPSPTRTVAPSWRDSGRTRASATTPWRDDGGDDRSRTIGSVTTSHTTRSTRSTVTPSRSTFDKPDPADAMDWTPTPKRFADRSVTVIPPLWDHPPAQPPPKQPHSLFARTDPNPFRSKVPEAPRNQLLTKRDPWASGKRIPAPAETRQTYLSGVGADGEFRAQLQNEAVPRNVRREAELFQKPKLKYDYEAYVGEKSTGLEESFHDLFKGGKSRE